MLTNIGGWRLNLAGYYNLEKKKKKKREDWCGKKQLSNLYIEEVGENEEGKGGVGLEMNG